MKDRIRDLRKKKGMNQTELAEVTGINANSISKIESGQNKPTIQQIEQLSKFFNVSADYLLFGKESAQDIEPIEREILKTIRDDKTLYGKLIKMLEAKKTVIDSFEGVAAW